MTITNRYLLTILLFGIGAIFSNCDVSPPKSQSRQSIRSVLATDSTNDTFERALTPRPFVFPKDAGSHPSFKSEWWYVTGNLKTETNQHFGYQLTIFRQAISDQPIQSASDWRTNQIYMGHLALTDVQNKKFYAFSRLSRGAIGLAGAQDTPYRIWIEDWEISGNLKNPHITARQDHISLELTLSSQKKIILQGEQGLSVKSRGLGNASYYYSQTRLSTQGTIEINKRQYQITGLSWFDREWSSSSLGEDEVGWDWFSLQLNDQREVMLYGIRKSNGEFNQYSSGVYVLADQNQIPIAFNEFEIEVLEFWTSPTTHIQYPAKWRLVIPKVDLDLIVTPMIPNQEHNHNFVYWEGAVSVKSNDTKGYGYVELVGYQAPSSQ